MGAELNALMLSGKTLFIENWDDFSQFDVNQFELFSGYPDSGTPQVISNRFDMSGSYPASGGPMLSINLGAIGDFKITSDFSHQGLAALDAGIMFLGVGTPSGGSIATDSIVFYQADSGTNNNSLLLFDYAGGSQTAHYNDTSTSTALDATSFVVERIGSTLNMDFTSTLRGAVSNSYTCPSSVYSHLFIQLARLSTRDPIAQSVGPIILEY